MGLFSSIVGPLVGAVVSGGFSAFGTSSANDANQAIAAQTTAFNAAEAKKNRQFQERMSSTAYQRSMKDMRKAGLNPILAYQQGGSSSPGGATASGVQYTEQNELEGAANSARMVASQIATIRLQEDQAKLAREQGQTTRAAGYLNKQLELKAKYETSSAFEAQRLSKVMTDIRLGLFNNPYFKKIFQGGELARWANPLMSSYRQLRR